MHHIFALLAQGADNAELREDYARLTPAMLAAAPVYARAHPRQGKPKNPLLAEDCCRERTGQVARLVTVPRFLIDENLSPALVEFARERGLEAMHINHLSLSSETDWELLTVIAAQDWVLVTNNAIEFRGRYQDIKLHPRVVFLLPSVRRPEQVRLFEASLDHVQAHPDMVNRALDVTFD